MSSSKAGSDVAGTKSSDGEIPSPPVEVAATPKAKAALVADIAADLVEIVHIVHEEGVTATEQWYEQQNTAMHEWLLLASAWSRGDKISGELKGRIEKFIVHGTMLMSTISVDNICTNDVRRSRRDFDVEAASLKQTMKKFGYNFMGKKEEAAEGAAAGSSDTAAAGAAAGNSDSSDTLSW